MFYSLKASRRSTLKYNLGLSQAYGILKNYSACSKPYEAHASVVLNAPYRISNVHHPTAYVEPHVKPMR